jgi:hypothetical protein
MATTVRDIVTDAEQEIGVLAAGEVASAADAEIGFKSLNSLLDQWAAERLQIYAITRTEWTIVSGTEEYTVGAAGDVNIARPVYIDHVNFIDTSPSDEIEYELQPLTDDAWSRVPIKDLESPFPTSWFYNPTYPLGTLTFWPVPTSSTIKGVIYHPTAVAEFASLATTVALPPGYRRMLIKNLAVDLASPFEREPSATLVQEAMETKAVVKRANKRLEDMHFEGGALIQGRNRRFVYNILSGP